MGFTRKARLNPFLAAESFLNHTGIKTTSYPELSPLKNLAGDVDTLIIFGWRLSMSERAVQDLQDWIQNGGHLITTAQSFYNDRKHASEDRFLDAIGVRKYKQEPPSVVDDDDGSSDSQPDSSNPQEVLESSSADSNPEVKKFLTRVKFEDVERPVWVQFSPYYTLHDASETATAASGNEFSTSILQYAYGKGTLTVLSDDNCLTNKQIDQHDHAYFLWLLMEDSEAAWLLFGGKPPSLLSLFWDHGAFVIISGLILIIAILWNRAFRFGPILARPSAARRQLTEHIIATTHFLWRHQRIEKLITTMKDDMDFKLRLRYKNYHHLPLAKRLSLLQKILDLPKDEIEWTLQGLSHPTMVSAGKKNEMEFLHLLQNHQQMRKQL